MKDYPSIPHAELDGTAYLFDKLDGSSLRVEWNPKKGFWKFGKRHGLIDDSNAFIKKGPDLFLSKYGDEIHRILVGNKLQKAILFFELWGPGSFAGQHTEGDLLTTTLFDAAIANRGLLLPGAFLAMFGGVDHAKMLYKGPLSNALVEEVRQGLFEGVTFEGVVCKQDRYASPGRPLMAKIKTRAWLGKLKERCGADEKMFNLLM